MKKNLQASMFKPLPEIHIFRNLDACVDTLIASMLHVSAYHRLFWNFVFLYNETFLYFSLLCCDDAGLKVLLGSGTKATW